MSHATARPPAAPTMYWGTPSSVPVRWAVTYLVLCAGHLWPSVGCLAADESRAADAPPAASATDDARAGPTSDDFEVITFAGKVVWWGEAISERLGVSVVPEAAQRTLALETDDGRLIPLIEDLRARAFRHDERLRAMDVELRVRRYRATPALQILTVFERVDGERYEVDYWCDICSIPMYETGPCACCQEDNRLRKRKVDPSP